MSNVKKLANELSSMETLSCKIIDSSNLYIIKIKLDNILTTDEIKKIATDELHSDPQPLVVYFNTTDIVLFFSYVAENYYLPGSGEIIQHQLSGNHHHIVSKYASKFARLLPQSKIIVSIVEFETQIQILTFTGWLISQTLQNAFVTLSNGKINEDLLQFRTYSELKDILLSSTGIEWNSLNNHTKYGTLLKLKRKKGKIIISEMSESFDARENKKYSKFIFG